MTNDQAIDKKAVIGDLTKMLDEPAPLRIGTLKALVLESLEVINQLIEKGWSYEDVAKRMQKNGVQIKGSTLRRYMTAVQPKVGKKRKSVQSKPVQERLLIDETDETDEKQEQVIAPVQSVSEPVKANEPEQLKKRRPESTDDDGRIYE